jgi:cytochrome c oxidase subunit 2
VEWVPFWPNTAATGAGDVNALFIAELVIAGLITAMVFGMMIGFGLRYRRGSAASRANQATKTWRFEIGWTTATLVAFLVLFVYGAGLYQWLYTAPRGDLEIYVVGKQWMWKMQHPGGQREIDELHVPVNKTVRLVLASQDVIHSFFVPAFRLKRDVVPGTYETAWFKPTKIGEYRLECAEFCGTQHAHMLGRIVVMAPADYARWLTDQNVHESLAQQGEALFRSYGCSGCHGASSTVHAPSLDGLYGRIVHLQDGEAVTADERYIRDCILLGASRIVTAGYPPIMPAFAGQIGEDDLIKLVAYIQSLGREAATP